jgi:O-acetyl-ADP-ribose deacetylase (regulator of RNase III)
MILSTGSILDSPCDLLVCPTNCVPGVMGKGLAKAFADRWPELIDCHRKFYGDGYAGIGSSIVFGVDNINEHNLHTKYIGFLATKNHWRNPSKLEWIEDGLTSLAHQIDHANNFPYKCDIRSVAVPALGCGLGGLDWADVEPVIDRWAKIIERSWAMVGFEVVVYPPWAAD